MIMSMVPVIIILNIYLLCVDGLNILNLYFMSVSWRRPMRRPSTMVSVVGFFQGHLWTRMISNTISINFYWRVLQEKDDVSSVREGRWSEDWARANITWEKHVLRGHDSKSWAKPLYEWHGKQWLNRQRTLQSRGDSKRTGTRAGPGRPPTRYFEGVDAAKRCLHWDMWGWFSSFHNQVNINYHLWSKACCRSSS